MRRGRIFLDAALLILAVAGATPDARAQTFSVLYRFTPRPNAHTPSATLTLDAAGDIYGTTPVGGTRDSGTVFRLDASNQFSILYSFGSGGNHPYAPVRLDANGNLYGTDTLGGRYHSGVAFKLNSAGKLTVLHAFGQGTDGAIPSGAFVEGPAGEVYGTTLHGGTDTACQRGGLGCGTVFQLKGRTETVLYNFTAGADGEYPQGLVRDSAGNLYGASSMGVFKLDSTGKLTTIYQTGWDVSQLLLDATGNLYGTTFIGGGGACDSVQGGGCGTVFKLDTDYQKTVLYSFKGYPTDGDGPMGGLIQDAAGNIYGTTEFGGSYSCPTTSGLSGCGTVFKLDPSGQETVLHAFTGGADGSSPVSGLAMDAQGVLYGTTTTGGTLGCGSHGHDFGCGVVFKITP